MRNEDKYYVDDGCQSEAETPPIDDFSGSFQSKSFNAGVRCCTMDGKTCDTEGQCATNSVTFDDAIVQCANRDDRLCTKNELLTGICCNTGGSCNDYPVWTSTKQENS